MTKTSHLLPLSLALSAALLLGACSKDAPAQAPAGKGSTATAGKVAVARGIIDVEGGLIALAPPVDGSITAAPVKEGATVKKGSCCCRWMVPCCSRRWRWPLPISPWPMTV